MTVALILIGSGIALALAYLALGRTRRYLLLLGLAFAVAGLGTLLGGAGATLCFIVATLLLILTVVSGVQDARERWARMRAESHDREDAFGASLAAAARHDAEDDESATRDT
ncbi:MAG TPA: hypothetical protein PLZ36_01830 [Armatimonadota bacterium]|nr:hypothetical protein [Armatimonadota bacterium]HOS42838.1 hypothetical protein [Armatimonadota bacterium]